MQYLAKKYKPALLGRTPQEMAQIEISSQMLDEAQLDLQRLNDGMVTEYMATQDHPSWIDFCWLQKLSEQDLSRYGKLSQYKERMDELCKPKDAEESSATQNLML